MIAPEGKTFHVWISDYSSFSGSGYGTREFGKEFKAGQSITITSSNIFEAIWKANCTITFSMGEGSGTPPTSIVVAYGKSFTFPAVTAPEGKIFQGWRDDSSWLDYQVGESLTVTAVYEKSQAVFANNCALLCFSKNFLH